MYTTEFLYQAVSGQSGWHRKENPSIVQKASAGMKYWVVAPCGAIFVYAFSNIMKMAPQPK